MRLKSGLWVRAYLRRCQREGAMAAVLRSGAEEAGAIFIKINLLNGSVWLYGPAPAGLDADGGRFWCALLGAVPTPESDADAYMARQVSYDEDLWIVEIEDRHGRHFLDHALIASEVSIPGSVRGLLTLTRP